MVNCNFGRSAAKSPGNLGEFYSLWQVVVALCVCLPVYVCVLSFLPVRHSTQYLYELAAHEV